MQRNAKDAKDTQIQPKNHKLHKNQEKKQTYISQFKLKSNKNYIFTIQYK